MLWPKASPLDLDFGLCAWAKLFNIPFSYRYGCKTWRAPCRAFIVGPGHPLTILIINPFIPPIQYVYNTKGHKKEKKNQIQLKIELLPWTIISIQCVLFRGLLFLFCFFLNILYFTFIFMNRIQALWTNE